MWIKTVTICCLAGQDMLTISKSLSAGQARTYHAREFPAEGQNYWSRDQQGHSEWQGSLAKEWGLHGNVGNEEFARLSEGRHPANDAQLVKHQRPEPTRISMARRSQVQNTGQVGRRRFLHLSLFRLRPLLVAMIACVKR